MGAAVFCEVVNGAMKRRKEIREIVSMTPRYGHGYGHGYGNQGYDTAILKM